jgi:predicted ester cyclase
VSDPKQILGRFFDEVLCRRDPAAAEELLAEDYVEHFPAPLQGPGPAGLLEALDRINTAFPDYRYEVEFVVGARDKVAAHWRLTGTNDGPLFTAEPSNKPIDVSGVDILELADGKVAARWSRWQTLTMLQQIGMAPRPVPAG